MCGVAAVNGIFPQGQEKRRCRMRMLICVVALVAAILVSGCTMPQSAVMAGLVIRQKGPVAGFDTASASTKVGRARAEGIILVGFGDASISAAAADVGITKIHHVDKECLNVLGIYSMYETIVYGE